MSSFRRAWLASASGTQAQDVAKACVEQLDGMIDGASLGIVFMTGRVAEMADDVVSILKDSLSIDNWFGGCSDGLIAGAKEITGEGGLAVLCLAMPKSSFQLIRSLPNGLSPTDGYQNKDQTIWLGTIAEHEQAFHLNEIGAKDIGGICSALGDVPLILNQPVAGGAIGLAFGHGLLLVAGMSRGTRDLGPWRRITSGVGGRIMELDGAPATALVEADTGELLARQPDRLIRQVIVETGEVEPIEMLMPRLALIQRFERKTGYLQIRDRRPGNNMRLVYRQAAPAKAELAELARALREAAQGQNVLAALLFSSNMRGEKLFGPGHDEAETLMQELGAIPLLGVRTCDELYQGQLTCGAAVLALLIDRGAG